MSDEAFYATLWDHVRIKEIRIRGLFGVFDYRIPLSSREDRITIIHAPNGYGKTTVFRLLNAVAEHDFREIGKTPFTELVISFDDHRVLRVTRVTGRKGGRQNREDPRSPVEARVSFEYQCADKKPIIFQYPSLEGPAMDHLVSRVDELENRIAMARNQSDPDGSMLGYREELFRLHYALSNERRHSHATRFRGRGRTQVPPDLAEFFKDFRVRFIASQRLFKADATTRLPRNYESHSECELREREQNLESVRRYSNELKDTIESKLSEYASKSQDLDRTFPSRLIDVLSKPSSEKNKGKREILKKLEDLDRRRKYLAEVGLLDPRLSPPPIKEGKISGDMKMVLALYLEDMNRKLDVFDELAKKISLLKSNMDSQFKLKSLRIIRGRGFVFDLDGNRGILEPTSLSSGEQHELVLNYELLFNTSPGSLVLIDEPEISLHVAWQQQFVDKLIDIARIADLDILIATHSPQIVHNHIDLTVELKGE